VGLFYILISGISPTAEHPFSPLPHLLHPTTASVLYHDSFSSTNGSGGVPLRSVGLRSLMEKVMLPYGLPLTLSISVALREGDRPLATVSPHWGETLKGVLGSTEFLRFKQRLRLAFSGNSGASARALKGRRSDAAS
jgi:hypothetical protein